MTKQPGDSKTVRAVLPGRRAPAWPGAERLEVLLEPRGTAAELARKTGIGKSDIGRFKAGERRPTVIQLRTLCEALNVSADWLLGVSGREDLRRQVAEPGHTYNPENHGTPEMAAKESGQAHGLESTNGLTVEQRLERLEGQFAKFTRRWKQPAA